MDVRDEYLHLLKLALCDLVGASTSSVERLPSGRLVHRELRGEERALRARGGDWPRHALTMTGLDRLSDLQGCVEEIVTDGVAGDLIEAGSWRGGSSILMRATLDTLPAAGERTVWVADSFRGFPEAPGVTVEAFLARLDFLAVPLSEVRESFARLRLGDGVRFLPGYFADTLPAVAGRRWSLVRLDADTYETTLLALRTLYPGLARDGHLIVDDYGALDDCRAAVDDFRRTEGITEPLHEVDWTCVRWRRATDPAAAAELAPPPPQSPPAPEPPAPELEIATRRELALEAELAELREQSAWRERQLAAERDGLRNELDEVTASTSWRVTRPLREISLRLRR